MPGRLASSMASWSEVSEECVGAVVPFSRAVLSEGWDMLFWPVMTLPFARPAEMWFVKFVFMAGRTEVCWGTEQMLERRYIADSKDPVKRRALCGIRDGCDLGSCEGGSRVRLVGTPGRDKGLYSPSQEKVANTSTGEVESGTRA